MQGVTGSLRQPGANLGVLVGRIIVDDEVNLEVFRDTRLDVAQEAQELLVTRPRLALGDHAAVGHVESRRQRRRATPEVVVGHTLDIRQAQRQDRLAVQCRL